MKKRKDLAIIWAIYLLAFAVGLAGCYFIENEILKYFVFDTVATVVTFVFSTILKNSSVYDAYWSLTPGVMVIVLFITNHAYSVFQLLFLIVFLTWSFRLTYNWVTVFTDFSYEDWRYRKFRNETPKILWPLVNFFGIHYMPTVVVFLGMMPIFVIARTPVGYKSLPGILIILCGICFEYFADRAMHSFLADATPGQVCQEGLWKYSRHPNYLGEIMVWLGVYTAMLPYDGEHWYYGIGFLAIAIMFNVVSIPLMETRQKSRRPEYEDYCKNTSRLIIRR